MFQVLQNKGQISAARAAMVAKDQSALVEVGWLEFIKNRLGFLKQLLVGDNVKSWDVLQTLEFIDTQVSRDANILDVGAYCSEVPVSLVKMGYINVNGVDLNPEIKKMPYSDKITYTISDFMQMPFSPNSFEVVTAISVIEHGYEPDRLFAELGRIIQPDGYFICSFDYWPEKIDTKSTKFFDLSWLIFSKEDVSRLVGVAKNHGFSLLGEAQYGANDPLISCMGFDYTFGWLVLRKTA